MAISISIFIGVWYLSTLLIAKAELHAMTWGKVRVQDLSDYTIILNDEILTPVPKLKDVLVKAPLMPYDGSCSCHSYHVTLSGLELDAMNRMLASTEKGQELIEEGWDNDYNRGQLLYDAGDLVTYVAYKDYSFQLVLLNYPLAFNLDEGPFTILFMFYVVSLILGGLVSYSSILLRRKGTNTIVVVLVFIAGIVILSIPLWHIISIVFRQ